MEHSGLAERHTVVVVDDDPDLRDLLAHVLGQAGWDVVPAENGAEAIALVRELDPDLVTLDLSLPDIDGTDVCRAVREFSDAFVLMVTGRDAEVDRLVGLEVGADDYLVKPISPRELLARVASLMRRPRAARPPVDTVAPPDDRVLDLGGGLTLHPGRSCASLGDRPLLLTPPEFAVLAALATRPGTPFAREELVREVWQGEFVESDFLVDVHVANLRRKLRRAGSSHSWVRAVGGSGYVLDPA